MDNSIQFNSIKVNPSISKQSLMVTQPYKHTKEPTDILYQKYGNDRQETTKYKVNLNIKRYNISNYNYYYPGGTCINTSSTPFIQIMSVYTLSHPWYPIQRG
jgi:hypothetical protein